MKRHSRIAVALAVSTVAFGQGVVTTVAGTGWILPRLTMPAAETPLGFVRHLTLDRDGNLLLLDAFNHMVFRSSNDGTLTGIAGNGLAGPAGGEVPATRAALSFPAAFAADRFGNIYIADDQSSYIRKVDSRGIISVIAGVGVRAPAEGVRALDVTFGDIDSMAALPNGDILVSDHAHFRIFRIDAAGIVRVFAGSGGQRCGSGIGGPATAAELCQPRNLVTDRQGNAYFSSFSSAVSRGAAVRRVGLDGMIVTVAGSGALGRPVNGAPATESPLEPVAMALDSEGRMVIASGFVSTSGQRTGDLVRVAAGGSIEILPAGGLDSDVPVGMAVLPDGSVVYATFQPTRIVRIRPGGTPELFAGSGKFGFGGDGGPATQALLNGPTGLAVDSFGNLYIADTGNGRIRAVNSRGFITTLAGNGEFVKTINLDDLVSSPPVEWPLFLPVGIAVTQEGILVFTSSFGVHFMLGDTLLTAGYATRTPGGIAFDGATAETYAGILFVDTAQHVAYRVPSNGEGVDVLAGAGAPASTGDGGPSTAAALNSPIGIAAAADRSVYISEGGGHRIRKISPNGIISTFAGNGRASAARMPAGPVAATGVTLTNPGGIALDAAGNLLVKSAGHISRITPDGQLRVIAGIGPRGVIAGDGGLATNAALATAGGIAVDAQGNIYFAEADFNRVRKILAQPPSFQASPATLEFSAASAGPPPRPQTVNVLSSVPSLGFNVQVRTANGGSWLSAGIASGVTPRLLQITASPAALAPGTYTGTIDLTAPNGSPRTVSINVRFTVGAALPANLQVDRTSLSFTYPRTARKRAQQLLLSNTGSGTVTYDVSVAAGSFLAVTPVRGSVAAAAPFALRVEADPASRAPGTYRDTITIRWSGGTLSVNAVMTISDREQAILLSQSGLSFQAVAQGGVTPPQSFGVINSGNGVMPWRVTTSTLAGGSWLRVSPDSGATDASSQNVPSVQVGIDQAGLEPGVYYGLVQVESQGAANTPHVLTVALEVLPPGARPGSVVQPRELTFRVVEGQSGGSEDLTVFNLTGNTVGYRSSAQSLSSTQEMVYAPIDASVAPREPQRVVVQPQTFNLPAGTHRSSMAFQFDDGTVRQVDVSVVVARGGLSSSTKIDPRRGADGCTPGRLLPAVRSLGQGSSVPAGWPAGVVVEVQDECGRQIDDGAVTMSFSNGDPPVALQSVKDGLWHGTWASRSAAGGAVTVKVQAEDKVLNIQGEREVLADLRAAYDPPEIRSEGVLNSGVAANAPL